MRKGESLCLCWIAGIMVVYATPNLPVAGVLSSLFFGIWNLFTGFLIGHQVHAYTFMHQLLLTLIQVLQMSLVQLTSTSSWKVSLLLRLTPANTRPYTKITADLNYLCWHVQI